jgi:two-component system chemotaxis sensor kinase CheA
MSISARIREQLISSFRAELTEHIQTMTDGLLALEQGRVAGGQHQSMLEDVFRAAHSLKGAARAVGITAIEQLAHALEDLLDAMRRDAIDLTPELFTACYQALDAIQAVQAAYESGETTPPVQALQALADLEPFRSGSQIVHRAEEDSVEAALADTPTLPPDEPSAEAESLAFALGQQMSAIWQEIGELDVPSIPPARTSTPDKALAAAPQPHTPPPPPSSSGDDETIRVGVSKLNALMAQLGELFVTKIRAEQRLAQVRHAQEFMALWQKEWLSVRGAYSRLVRQDISGALGLRRPGPIEGRRPGPIEGRRPEFIEGWKGSALSLPKDDDRSRGLGKDMLHLLNYVAASQERLREMNALMNDLSRRYADDTMHMSLAIDELEQEVKRVRMLPLSTITGSFGRMVRDLAQEAGKEAVLQIVGGDTELDKRVLEQIKDPLIHLLRNAIEHGIESPEHRVALGKPSRGAIVLTVEQLGEEVVICVSDDGAGLDLDAIRQAVARQASVQSSSKGEISAQALTEAELAEIIFKVGISTSPIVTDVSGRGVGLDVVRRNVEALHGRVDIDWTPGEGASFTLTLPLTLTSSRGLLVRVSDELFVIPLNAIERIMYVNPQEISPLEGCDTMRYNGRPLTVVRLKDVLELPHVDVQREERTLVVVVAAAERCVALVVDELTGEQEIVIKGLGKPLVRVGGIAGATVMGSGEVVLILNVADLIKLATRGEHRSVFDTLAETAPLEEVHARRCILIVDDSITTRTLEKNILEAAGYTVGLATDGQEALSIIATSGVPDLIVTDIVMPRMDGFELTRRIKGDTGTAGVPVILVTSLNSPQDKARGIEVGADAYIVKSSFDQSNLLETIEQLI